MVGRFNVRAGSGDTDWIVFDNAANGNRGSGLTEDAAHQLAADLELQYDVYGPRKPEEVRRFAQPVPVERIGQPGVLAGWQDCWVRDRGIWVGRVKTREQRYVWIPGSELRKVDVI
ncbi:hypothetical protein ACQHIV_42105 (plasmid) [Kribbella sp. GL6]|uniref:hypothetical protein n=1 Tax=Kribbella sp. GL6 TaxID=3419765 RepID=UPI003D07E6C2